MYFTPRSTRVASSSSAPVATSTDCRTGSSVFMRRPFSAVGGRATTQRWSGGRGSAWRPARKGDAPAQTRWRDCRHRFGRIVAHGLARAPQVGRRSRLLHDGDWPDRRSGRPDEGKGQGDEQEAGDAVGGEALEVQILHDLHTVVGDQQGVYVVVANARVDLVVG